eukprot:714940-Pyramimonas_sp.AAC.1
MRQGSSTSLPAVRKVDGLPPAPSYFFLGHLCRWVPLWRPRKTGGLAARSSPQLDGAVGETLAL